MKLKILELQLCDCCFLISQIDDIKDLKIGFNASVAEYRIVNLLMGFVKLLLEPITELRFAKILVNPVD